MSRFIVNALLALSFIGAGALAQVNISTASPAELKKLATERTTELQSAVVLTSDLNKANATRIQNAFASAFEFVDTIVRRTDIENDAKFTLVAPVMESIAASYGDNAAPFTDISTDTRGANFGQMLMAKVGSFFGFWWKQVDFLFVSWFKKHSETPLETLRRVKIGKNVFESLSKSVDLVAQTQEASQKPLNEFQKKVIEQYSQVVNAGMKSEPYRYRNFTRGVMLTVTAIAGFYVLAPIGLQEHVLFMPPIDFFPPFTFMDRTFSSVFVARGLWAMYATMGYMIPRLSTGFSLGSMIAKTRDKFRKIREAAGMKVAECELGLAGNTIGNRQRAARSRE